MGKKEMKEDISKLYNNGSMSLAEIVDGICETIKRHSDAISDITYSYRICANDTGFTRAFSLKAGAFSDMDETDEADVTVSGMEEGLLAVFRRQISPMSAMLRGKVKVKGSMPALVKFAEFL